MTKAGDRFRFKSCFGRFAMFVVIAALVAQPPLASAIILIEVIGTLVLFEIEGVSFPLYSTSDRTRLHISDTETDRAAVVEVQGQREWHSHLTLFAFSRMDDNQKVRIEIDVSPLRGPAVTRFFELDGRGVAESDVTDPALAALEGPLTLFFILENQTPDPDLIPRRAVYRLYSVVRRDPPDSNSR